MSGTNQTTKHVGATGNQLIDGVLAGIGWDKSTIYYSFPTSSIEYTYSGESATFGQVSGGEITAAYFALDTANGNSADDGFSVEGFTNLNIVYTTSAGANIRYAESNEPSTSWAYYPSTDAYGGDVWFGTSNNISTAEAGNYEWYTVLHETGHALGLKHGNETDTYGALPYDYDSMEYSVMTYNSYVGSDARYVYNETWGFAQTYMMSDIAALQAMYGANYTTNSGNTVYSWDPNSGDTLVNGVVAIDAGANRIFATIWDGGGIDTYDLSAYTSNLAIDLSPGGYSYFSSTADRQSGQWPLCKRQHLQRASVRRRSAFVDRKRHRRFRRRHVHRQ